jgi:molybdopterin molybdotransferase
MAPHANEIDEGAGYIGYQDALGLVYSNTKPLGPEKIPLMRSANRIAAEDAIAIVCHPTIDVSLKDGFAIRSADIAQASLKQPADIKVIGSAFAGSSFGGSVSRGQAVRVCSGAPIPMGADAVVSVEFSEELSKEEVKITADAGTGRNILRKGVEIEAGTVIVEKGGSFSPGNMGLAAAAGISTVHVYRRPKVGIISVGDELVLPGEELGPGQVPSSNMITMQAWLSSFGIVCISSVVPDNTQDIKRVLAKQLLEADAVLTSGGAWGSSRDLVVGTLDELGWEKAFHRVRMGPGKGVAFGLWRNKPVFCLPGGPASNQMAFLQLALPGILHMSGDRRPPLPSIPAKLMEDVQGRHRAWTEFKDAVLSRDSAGTYTVGLHLTQSRLKAIADANGFICIPEGRECLRSGEIVPVQAFISGMNIIEQPAASKFA